MTPSAAPHSLDICEEAPDCTARVSRRSECEDNAFGQVRLAESMVAATPDEAVDYYRELVGCGMRYFFVTVAPVDEETLRLLAEHVLPRLAV